MRWVPPSSPWGSKNPLRLAEDLATTDILSGGRLNPGVSVGTPLFYEHFKTALYPETHDIENFSKERVLRLLACLRGVPVSDFDGGLLPTRCASPPSAPVVS
ncbi:hypothetical protein MAGR_31370 [Mycolicibacterium agri]|uniref:Uncharacterized protein n=1 Tax=Mycolicibacterium agri TaxID=36811 RepID=A0A7I9W3C4_MYCAG|nr:hypothetical protein MAGR_31370 [Mycolicibacterium agri]